MSDGKVNKPLLRFTFIIAPAGSHSLWSEPVAQKPPCLWGPFAVCTEVSQSLLIQKQEGLESPACSAASHPPRVARFLRSEPEAAHCCLFSYLVWIRLDVLFCEAFRPHPSYPKYLKPEVFQILNSLDSGKLSDPQWSLGRSEKFSPEVFVSHRPYTYSLHAGPLNGTVSVSVFPPRRLPHMRSDGDFPSWHLTDGQTIWVSLMLDSRCSWTCLGQLLD